MNRKDLEKKKKDELIEIILQQTKKLSDGKKVEGEFEDAKTAKVYTIKDGWAKTRNSRGQVVASSEILKDTAEMRRLIDMGYGGLEVVRELEVDDNEGGDNDDE